MAPQHPSQHIPRLLSMQRLVPHGRVSLTSTQVHRLRRVLRLQDGATFHVFHPADGEFTAELLAEDGARVHTRLRPAQSQPPLTLMFAPIRSAHMGWLAEKATELGVTTMQPVRTAYTNWPKAKRLKMHETVTYAAEQCDRVDVPVIHDLCPLREIIAQWDPATPLYVAVARGDVTHIYPAVSAALRADPNRPMAVLIGPEGGFSEAELAALTAQPFVQCVTLGPTVMRAETAALAACVQVSTARACQPPPRSASPADGR